MKWPTACKGREGSPCSAATLQLENLLLGSSAVSCSCSQISIVRAGTAASVSQTQIYCTLIHTELHSYISHTITMKCLFHSILFCCSMRGKQKSHVFISWFTPSDLKQSLKNTINTFWIYNIYLSVVFTRCAGGEKHTNCAVLELYVFNLNKHFARASAFRCTCFIWETSVTDRLPLCVRPYNICNKRKMHKLSL